MKKAFVLLLCLPLLAACVAQPASSGQGTQSTTTPVDAPVTMLVRTGGETFTAQLNPNAAAEAFLQLLPLSLYMQELNGNEKFSNLNAPLPTAPQSGDAVQAGDIMLYGEDCLVLFYESFTTPYQYTPIATLQDAAGLAQVLGNGGVQVHFSLAEEP